MTKSVTCTAIAGLLLAANISAAPLSILHSFDSASKDGAFPLGSLALNGGTLYGMTMSGGDNDLGSVFQVSTNGSGYSVLRSWAGAAADGSMPLGSPVVSGSTLYGQTQYGGSSLSGTVFALTTSGSFSLLHSFGDRGGDGGNPWGGLLRDGATLYGCTRYGGSNNAGTIFKINEDGSNYAALYSFSTGQQPSGSLVLENGTLYGMTAFGGAGNYGTIFSISTNGTGYTTLHSFTGGPWDGSQPRGSLICSGGTLYGMAPFGGSYGGGIVFSLSTSGANYTVLREFSGAADDGAHPYGSLILGSGRLFGMTTGGGETDEGTIFRMESDGAGFVLLHSFSGGSADGACPYGSLIRAGDMVYGMTSRGGSTDDGVVFSLDAPIVLTANFTATPTSGWAPLTVSFVDVSSGEITNRFWDFGDGSTTNITETTIAHTYTAVGSNTVRLIISGPDGISTNTWTNCISVVVADTTIVAETTDQGWGSADITGGWIDRTSERVGSSAAGIFTGLVIPFWIPDLHGLQITDAELSVTVVSGGLTYSTGLANADIYGVRANASVSTPALGDLTAGTLLLDNLFNINPSLPLGVKTGSSDSLVAWLNEKAGTNGQMYVLLCVRPDAIDGTYRYATLSTANAATGKPTLRLVLSDPTAGASDDDSDGLPNEWEMLYFGGTTNANPAATASNGVNTILEAYIAGLDPTDPQAVFTVSNDWKTLRWNAASGRVYSVWATTNLISGFQPLETNILWPQNSWTNPAPAANEFFKLNVEMQ